MNYNNDPNDLLIVSISKNKLVLRDEGSFEGDDPGDETYGFTRMD